MPEYVIDAKRGRIDDHGIRCRLHGSDTAFAIAFVSRGDFPKKGREINTNSFSYQLFITPLGTLFEARRKENFELRVGENEAAHVPAVGHQARRTAESALARKQRHAHPWVAGDP